MSNQKLLSEILAVLERIEKKISGFPQSDLVKPSAAEPDICRPFEVEVVVDLLQYFPAGAPSLKSSVPIDWSGQASWIVTAGKHRPVGVTLPPPSAFVTRPSTLFLLLLVRKQKLN